MFFGQRTFRNVMNSNVAMAVFRYFVECAVGGRVLNKQVCSCWV